MILSSSSVVHFDLQDFHGNYQSSEDVPYISDSNEKVVEEKEEEMQPLTFKRVVEEKEEEMHPVKFEELDWQEDLFLFLFSMVQQQIDREDCDQHKTSFTFVWMSWFEMNTLLRYYSSWKNIFWFNRKMIFLTIWQRSQSLILFLSFVLT